MLAPAKTYSPLKVVFSAEVTASSAPRAVERSTVGSSAPDKAVLSVLTKLWPEVAIWPSAPCVDARRDDNTPLESTSPSRRPMSRSSETAWPARLPSLRLTSAEAPDCASFCAVTSSACARMVELRSACAIEEVET